MSYEDKQFDDDNDEREGEGTPSPTWRRRATAALTRLQFASYTMLIVLLLLISFLWPRMFISIPAGHHGVMYRLFAGGTVRDRVWKEGLNVIPPWDALTIYETRLQEKKVSYNILSEEGVDLGVVVSVRYRPYLEMLGNMHHEIGPEYYERLVRPEVEAHVRHTFGRHPASDIYGSAPSLMQELGHPPSLGRQEKREDPDTRAYVDIEELKLIDITLPELVKTAIAERYRQEQLMLEYRYRLLREEQESERKRTEAAGIRDYNLIAGNIAPDLLRWRGIDATLELAKSPNTKVVVLGGGQGGSIPFMMNLEGGTPPPPQNAANNKGNAAANAAPAAANGPPPGATPSPAAVP